jgi:RHS repeat-associated protein
MKVTYSYIADGTKFSATADTFTVSIASLKGKFTYVKISNGFDYLGSFVYSRNIDTLTLESTSFAGGRINKTNNSYEINYFITDHLGSTRVIVNANGSILEQKDYYPFGKEHENANLMSSTNRWNFSGKEKQTIRDLGWLDFSARMYANCEMPIFTTQDPLAEKYYSISPYAYCGNNPVNNIDPDGRDWFVNNENGNVFFIRGLSDLTKIDNLTADWLTKNGIDISNKDIYENLGKDDLIAGIESSGYIPMNSEDGWDYSKQFMAENGFVPADKVTVEEKSIRTHYMEVDGGMHYSEPVTSSQELNRVKNSYAKPEDMYKRNNTIYDNSFFGVVDRTTTTSNYKVPAGASHYNFKQRQQERRQERNQDIFQKSMELIKNIVTTFFSK